ncbi:hypothetical protein CICLE_v10003822mg [Citrus x clementina]|uniref:TTF-type domain-containing protein n=1 Tax=Citrus clementina TaxID=85681 RepID=V4T5H4_CITCL|nr:hypothetical protein CICLE_v10003822mg [Citrus x clementina]
MQNRRFQFSWFSNFPWLEYSISKDKAFCFPYFLFYDTSTKFVAFIVDVVKIGTCAFRGHDESVNSLNHGNFIELIKLLATMNEEINKVVLENALKNVQYIAPKNQKELLNILANKVRHKIRKETMEFLTLSLADS